MATVKNAADYHHFWEHCSHNDYNVFDFGGRVLF